MAQVGVRLLGHVVVEIEGQGQRTRSTLLRTLLALLTTAPRRVVSTDGLIDELWGDDLPRDPPAALAVQVSRLRNWLVLDTPRSTVVRSEYGGYLLDIDPEQIDLVRFDTAADAATTATGDRALALTESALQEWRGDPFGGCVPGERLQAEQVRLVERRLWLVERRAELQLARGEPERVLEGLAEARVIDTGRERFTLLTMLAHRSLGRRLQALEVYREFAGYLREEYGLSPSSSLQRVQAQCLADDVPVAPDGHRRTKGSRSSGRRVVGRDRARRELREALDVGGLVLVTGPAGIGKSVLVRALLAEVAASGAHVGFGGWDHDDAPLSAWQEALAGLDARAPAQLGSAPVTGADLHRRVSVLARAGGVVIALDDAHRADAASLGALRGLVRRGLPPGALVLVTARIPEATAGHATSPWDAAFPDLALADGVRRIGLAELAPADIVVLAIDALAHLGADAARRVGRAVATRSAGHPLYAAALLDDLRLQPDEPACLAQVDVVPDAVRPLLAQQVALLPSACRRRLEALAALRPVPLDPFARALGTTVLSVVEDVRPALDAGLLVDAELPRERLDFRHDLVADVVQEAVPAAQRKRWHRAVLDTLGQDGDPFERRRHGLAAGSLVATGELADLHRRAAHAAYRRGAAGEALDLFAEAAEHAAAHDRVNVVLGRGLALTALGRLDEAHDVLDAVVADVDTTRAQAHRAAVGDGSLGAQVTGDRRRLDRLRRVAARPTPATSHDSPDRDRMELLLATTVEETVLDGRVTSPEMLAELAGLAVRLADDADADVAVRARLILLRGTVEAPVRAVERLATARAVAGRAADAHEVANRLDAGEALLSALLAAGRIEEARDLCWALQREARRVHRPRTAWVALLVETSLALAAGEIDEADRLAARAHALGRDAGLPDADGTLQAFTMVRHWQAGTAVLLGEVPAVAAAAYPHIPAWTAAAACAAVQAGHPEQAAEHLRRFRERRAVLEARTFDRPAVCLAAAAAFRLHDRDTAHLVCDALPADPDAVVVLGIGAAIIGPATFFRALAEAVLGDEESALDHLHDASALAGNLGWEPWKTSATAVAERIENGRGPALPLGLSEAR